MITVCKLNKELHPSAIVNIGAEGAGRLAGVLGQCFSLAELHLGGNGIGAEGAGRLAGVLGQCSSLAELDLERNGIGAEGVERLAVAKKALDAYLINSAALLDV